MNFQDALKSSIKAKSDVDAENKKQRQDDLSKRASNTVATAKTCLINGAKNGNHTSCYYSEFYTLKVRLHKI